MVMHFAALVNHLSLVCSPNATVGWRNRKAALRLFSDVAGNEVIT